jgi:hypothetical protein
VQLIRVADLPCTTLRTIVVGLGLALRGQLGALRIEGIAIEVLSTANRRIRWYSIRDEDGVVWAIHVCVDTEAEQMLVVVRIYTCNRAVCQSGTDANE